MAEKSTSLVMPNLRQTRMTILEQAAEKIELCPPPPKHICRVDEVIVFRRNGLRIGEFYFSNSPVQPPQKVDLFRIAGVLDPREPDKWKAANTLIINLTQGEEELFSQVQKTTRYEIRRALDKDELALTTYANPSLEEVAEFCDFYDEFAGSRSLRPIFRPRLYSLARANMLVLTSAGKQVETPLVWHAYVASQKRMMLLYSASLFRHTETSADRNLLGRANRCLHWKDILHAKKIGALLYDMGGIDIVGEDPQKARIAEFKRGFGGQVVATYFRTCPRSFKGRLVQRLLGLMSMQY